MYKGRVIEDLSLTCSAMIESAEENAAVRRGEGAEFSDAETLILLPI